MLNFQTVDTLPDPLGHNQRAGKVSVRQIQANSSPP